MIIPESQRGAELARMEEVGVEIPGAAQSGEVPFNDGDVSGLREAVRSDVGVGLERHDLPLLDKNNPRFYSLVLDSVRVFCRENSKHFDDKKLKSQADSIVNERIRIIGNELRADNDYSRGVRDSAILIFNMVKVLQVMQSKKKIDSFKKEVLLQEKIRNEIQVDPMNIIKFDDEEVLKMLSEIQRQVLEFCAIMTAIGFTQKDALHYSVNFIPFFAPFQLRKFLEDQNITFENCKRENGRYLTPRQVCVSVVEELRAGRK